MEIYIYMFRDDGRVRLTSNAFRAESFADDFNEAFEMLLAIIQSKLKNSACEYESLSFSIIDMQTGMLTKLRTPICKWKED